MNLEQIKYPYNPKLMVSVYSGHFATRHSHNSHYIDITRMKHEHTMAREAATGPRPSPFRIRWRRTPSGGISR